MLLIPFLYFQCVLNIKEAFKSVDLLLSQGNYAKLSKDFQSCEPIATKSDAYTFASNLADIFMSVVQYNAEMPGFNITGLCESMTKPGDAYHNLVQLNDVRILFFLLTNSFSNFDCIIFQVFLNKTSTKCGENSWVKMIKEISNTTVDRSDGAGMRQWLYQTCTQFGYCM